MQTIRAAGLTRAFSSTGSAPRRRPRTSAIDDYLEVIDQSVDLLGGRVNLIGDCQGGWLTTIYSALHPERVNTLTIAGAPIDFHCGEPLIHAWVEAMKLDFYRAPRGLRRRRAQGRVHARRLRRARAAGRDLQAPAAARRARRRGVPRPPPPLRGLVQAHAGHPGPFYLWIVEHLFRNNELLHGELQIQGETVDLRRIDCPVNLIGGAKDHITPPDQVYALADAVSTPPELVQPAPQRRRSPRPVHESRGASEALASDASPRVRALDERRRRGPLRPVNAS